MEYAIIITIVVVLLVVLALATTQSANNKLRHKLAQAFGKPPANQKHRMDSIEEYNKAMLEHCDSLHWVDQITWDDLEMDKVFKGINACTTSVGEEYLYHILHTQCASEEQLSQREQFIAALKSVPASRLDLQFYLSRLGKSNYNHLSSYIFDMELNQLKYPRLYSALAALPIIGALLIALNIPLGLTVLITAYATNLVIHFTLKRRVDSNLKSFQYFSSMLWCCNKILRRKDARLWPFLVELEQSYRVFRSLGSKISGMTRESITTFDFISDYFRIIFLSDFRSYNKIVKKILRNKESYHQLYKSVGEIDASIAILSFRESLPQFCLPQFHEDNYVEFEGIFHPLLTKPIPNDATINKHSIITGSNASGKSTFIKAIAINGILAQSINTCTAVRFTVCRSLVITSMAVRDHISEGESYFITEIKSLKRILDRIEKTRCLCFIDEILKGTNTIERIAASASIMRYILEKNCLCIVASHDMELTEILKDAYDNYHFSEQISDDGIYFDYKLKQGVAQTRNAIKLLHFMNFDEAVIDNAEGLVDMFMRTQKWH